MPHNRWLNRHLSLSRQSDEARETALALNTLAMITADHGDFPLARRFFEESLTIRRALDDTALVASTLNNLGPGLLARRVRGCAIAVRRESRHGPEGRGQTPHGHGTRNWRSGAARTWEFSSSPGAARS